MITAPAARHQSVIPDLEALRRGFNDLAMDLTRSDAQLTSMYEFRDTVGANWSTWFSDASHKALALRDGAMDHLQAVGRGDLVAKLGADALSLSDSSGRMAVMHRKYSTLDSAWTTTLDHKINNFVDAANSLVAAPPVPPTPPTPPVPPTEPAYRSDMVKAVQLIQDSIEKIRAVPAGDAGTDGTKETRIAAYKVNLAAQALIEPHFSNGTDPAAVSTMRRADASLEDANWQLAKKPSPDGRFNGVDIPGALRDSQAAVDLLNGLIGNPAT